MANPARKGTKLVDPKHRRFALIGVVLKCSVCVLLLSLVWEIGMHAADTSDGIIVAGAYQHGAPYSFYVK